MGGAAAWSCPAEQGPFPHPCLQPARSLPCWLQNTIPGSFFQGSVTSDHSCTGCLMPNRASISGEIFVASTNPFSPKDCKHFQGLGWSSSASNSSATQQQKGTTFLHCQLSHLLLNRSSQKISSRRSNTLVYSRRV